MRRDALIASLKNLPEDLAQDIGNQTEFFLSSPVSSSLCVSLPICVLVSCLIIINLFFVLGKRIGFFCIFSVVDSDPAKSESFCLIGIDI
jgi:hypothetical protein